MFHVSRIIYRFIRAYRRPLVIFAGNICEQAKRLCGDKVILKPQTCELARRSPISTPKLRSTGTPPRDDAVSHLLMQSPDGCSPGVLCFASSVTNIPLLNQQPNIARSTNREPLLHNLRGAK